MDTRTLGAIVLAAGEGTRMHSSIAKPLHPVCGRPMLLHILDRVAELGVDDVVVVVGFQAPEVARVVEDAAPVRNLTFVEQLAPRGTGDAVSVGLTGFPEADPEGADVLVVPGDAPLVRTDTLERLVASHRQHRFSATVLSAVVPDPTGYGRITRAHDGRVVAIVEEADASDAAREVREVNSSIYCFDRVPLAPSLRRIAPHNAQGEYYLTDVVGVLADAGYPIGSVVVEDAREVMGVNDRSQLATAAAVLRQRINAEWLARGVAMVDPAAVYVDATVTLGREAVLYPGTVLEGRTAVGDGAVIGPGCRLVDTRVGDGARLDAVVARDAVIGDGAVVGPFASLAPGDVVPGAVRTSDSAAEAPR